MTTRLPSLELQATRSEKLSGLLSATLILLSLLTMVMLVVWLTHQQKFASVVSRLNFQPSLPKEEERGSGSQGGAEVFQPLDDAGSENLPWVADQASENLKLVSTLAATELAALERSGGAKGKGEGEDEGDGRKKGPRGDGNVIPNWQRWQIRYAAADIREYAAILDAFGVELGVMGGGSQSIDYARNLSQAKPTVRSGKPGEETRLRFTFARGDLREADRTLAEKAGLSVDGRIVCQFFPDSVQKQLELLERAAIGTRPLDTVRHTQFGIRQGSRGLEFHVLQVEPSMPPTGLAPL